MKLKLLFISLFAASLFISCKQTQEKQEKEIVLTEDIVIFKPIILPSGWRFDGAGYSVTVASGANCPAIIVGSALDDPEESQYISITNVVIDGNAKDQPDEIWGGRELGVRNNGISVRRAKNVTIDNVQVKNCRSGGIVLERGCRDVIVSNSSSQHNVYDGLAAYESENCIFLNLDLSNNKAAGISLDLDMNKNYLIKNKIENNGQIGIFMRDSNENHFEDSSVSRSDFGVFLATSEQGFSAAANNVFKNFVFNSNKTAFRVNNIECVGNSVSNPVFINNGVNISEAEKDLVLVK